MLDLSHPIHQAFLRFSQAVGLPWPPDPYLGSLKRLRLLQDLIERRQRQLEVKLATLDRLYAMHERTQGEARDIVASIDELCDAAEYVARDAARERPHSPWGGHG